jgi:hypothetical protein
MGIHPRPVTGTGFPTFSYKISERIVILTPSRNCPKLCEGSESRTQVSSAPLRQSAGARHAGTQAHDPGAPLRRRTGSPPSRRRHPHPKNASPRRGLGGSSPLSRTRLMGDTAAACRMFFARFVCINNINIHTYVYTRHQATHSSK